MLIILSKKLKYFNEKRGFSLIELMVIVAIIAILAGLVLTNLTPARRKAKDVAFKTTVSSIVSAAGICCNSSGSPILNDAIGGEICTPPIGSKYPNATQISSITITANCADDKFDITVAPGTINRGNCSQADCTEEGCTFVDC